MQCNLNLKRNLLSVVPDLYFDISVQALLAITSRRILTLLFGNVARHGPTLTQTSVVSRRGGIQTSARSPLKSKTKHNQQLCDQSARSSFVFELPWFEDRFFLLPHLSDDLVMVAKEESLVPKIVGFC